MQDPMIVNVRAYLLKEYVWLGALVIILAAYFFLAVPIVLHGPYNPDDGWYLYDAWQTWLGHTPYHDFAFPQPPLILIWHGFWQRLWGESWLVGRMVNVLLGSVGVALTAIIARRLGGITAGILAGAIVAFSPWYALQMAGINTYALAIIGLLLIAYTILKNCWGWAGCLAVCVVWTRLPFMLVLPAVLLLSLFFEPSRRWQYWRATLLGIGAATVFLVLPFFLIDADKTYVNVVGFQTYTRQAVLANYQVIINYIRTDYLALYRWPWIFALTGLGVFWPSLKASRQLKLFILLLLLTAISTAAAQATATNITYDTPLLPWLAISGGYGLSLFVTSLGQFKKVAYGLMLLGIVWPWLGVPLELYQGRGDNEESIANIHRIAVYIDRHSLPSDLLLTPELYVAIEAKRQVMPGFGIGRFFYFPEFS